MSTPQHEAINNPRLFVVVPTYNRWPEARVSLACLMKSTYENFQVLLIEDACTDGPLRSAGRGFPRSRFSTATAIYGGAAQLTWELSTLLSWRRSVLWINDDVRVEPETIGHLVATVEREWAPECRLRSHKVDRFKRSGVERRSATMASGLSDRRSRRATFGGRLAD